MTDRPGSKSFLKSPLSQLKIQELIDKDLKQGEIKQGEIKQGTARQLALTFYFMIKAKTLPSWILDKSKNARFLEFLTGTSAENLRKKITMINNHDNFGANTKNEYEKLINDINRVKSVFEDSFFDKEVRLIEEKLEILKADHESMREE